MRARPGRTLLAVVAVALVTAGCSGGHPTAQSGRSSSPSSDDRSVGASSRPDELSPSSPATSVVVAGPVPNVPIATARQQGSPTPTPSRITTSGPTPTIAGCPLFPADNAWRRNVSADPVEPRSGAWVASIGATTKLHPDFGSNSSYGIPYVVVAANQPTVPITFTDYGDESDPGPYPVPLTAPIESGGDAHVLVASANCRLYELYGAARSGNGWSAASGAVFNLASNALRPDGWTSADAAGLPILPGLVRRDEVQSGQINHALRFTVSKSQRGYIHPATHAAGSTSDPDVPPMGARFRLKASFDLSGFHGAALVILQALKTYGMIVADNGSSWYISGATDPGWDDNDLNQLKTIPGSAFEAVQSGAVLH